MKIKYIDVKKILKLFFDIFFKINEKELIKNLTVLLDILKFKS
jgi:hypothetical protein